MLILFGSVDEQQHPHSERNTRPGSQQHGSPQLIASATSSAGPLPRSIGDDPQPACSSLASQVSQRIGSLSGGPADAPNPTRDGRCLACALTTVLCVSARARCQHFLFRQFESMLAARRMNGQLTYIPSSCGLGLSVGSLQSTLQPGHDINSTDAVCSFLETVASL